MSDKDNYEIAIIGMSGRFPGAKNLEEFWRNVRDGVESISFLSDEELLAAGCEPSKLDDPNFVKAEGSLDDVELFDASFFGFTPREAEMTDPQHRLFLEHAWQALEEAGYDAGRYRGRIGVYAGESINSYLLHNLYPHRRLLDSAGAMQTVIGNDRDYLATHVSYKLNLKGPSISVQTSCSTSLVAVHVACQSLLSRECDMALAGGVSVSVPQKQGAMHQTGGIISPDGHCRAFDADAQGTIKGSGVGVVLLKRLNDALADGDTIHVVVKGSAVNNDGSSKVGYTAPSVEGQAGVIEEALALALVEPETVGYVETHGTGTSLGDPIEMAALTQAFRTSTEAKGFCAVGSVKTNIGHTDAAAGIAGLIKTVFALKHKQLPPSLHFTRPNPNIDFDNSPFFVNTKLTNWPTGVAPRRAGVSSFGIGGTNAHVILEEAPAVESFDDAARPQLLTLSAKTETALEQAATNLSAYLKRHDELHLADVAYTLQVGRREFKHRRAVVCRDMFDAASVLATRDRKSMPAQWSGDDARVVFMFSGQGTQYVGMGRELYESLPLFRHHVDHCAELLKPHLEHDLREVLYATPEHAAEAATRLTQTSLTQPALFVVEYALARVWMEWGVEPRAMIGHSIGEYVAACLAGVFSLADALMLVAARGRLMQQMPEGAMLAVSLPERDAQSLCGHQLTLAAVNAPSLCVLSGTTGAIEEAELRLAADGVITRRLHVSHALHSTLMEPAVEPFIERVRHVELSPPQLPLVSTLTGTWMTADEATDPRYWGRQLRHTVRFADGMAVLLADAGGVLLEVGAGQTLGTLARQQWNETTAQSAEATSAAPSGDATAQCIMLSSLRHPHDNQSDTAFLLNALGQLWQAGVEVNWPALHAGREPRRIPLPTYPFERQRYWIEPPADAEARAESSVDLSRKTDAAEWFYVPSWKRSVVPEPDAEQDAPDADVCWLVFGDEAGLAARIMPRLAGSGATVFEVGIGTGFKKIDERVFELNPQERADYIALLKELRAQKKFPRKILHLWNVTTDEASGARDAVAFDDAQQRGFYSLIYLAQALGEYGAARALEIGVVSNNLYEVTGEENLMPEKATLLGACKVIPLEYARFECRSLDIEWPVKSTAQAEQLADNLLAELVASAPDTTVAYRGLHRWVQIFEPLRLAQAGEHTTPKRLREKGVYLLTGGASGIDLAIARHLSETAHARCVFTGRTDLPPRADWEGWLATHDEREETGARIKELLSLEAAGAEFMMVDADIAAREEVETFLREVRERFGEINGVIHTAATTGGGMIQLKTPELMTGVLSPKVAGTLVLDELLRDTTLDFCALFSTSLALTGVFGQVDYCAANSFLDAFAHARTLQGETFNVSINWHIPHWEQWQQSALAGAPEFQEQLAHMREAYGISLREGAEAFVRVLRGTQPQVVVSTQNFQALIDEQRAAIADAGLFGQTDASRPSAVAAHARQDAGADATPPASAVEHAVAGVWQEMFGIARLGIHDNFFDLGGNSLLAIQLISQLRQTFDIELPLSSLFESPTIAGLSSVIVRQQQQEEEAEEIERLLREIESLSLDEVQSDLAQELQSEGETKRDG